MLEQTRLDYLQAMGVAQWMPRRPLPFAPESRWLATNANLAGQAQSEEETDVNEFLDVDALLDEQAPQVEADNKAVSPKADIASVAPKAPELDPDRNIIPNFHLSFIGSTLPVVWVCDNLEEIEMLQRFIFSVQKALIGRNDFVGKGFEFRWPFLQSNQQDQGLPVALQALKAHWLFMQQTHNAQGVITFGESSQHWLQQVGVKQIFAAPSVTELLHSADQKRQLWHSLLPLL